MKFVKHHCFIAFISINNWDWLLYIYKMDAHTNLDEFHCVQPILVISEKLHHTIQMKWPLNRCLEISF